MHLVAEVQFSFTILFFIRQKCQINCETNITYNFNLFYDKKKYIYIIHIYKIILIYFLNYPTNYLLTIIRTLILLNCNIAMAAYIITSP